MSFVFRGVDHVQLAAYEGCETEARAFFGGVLGWGTREVENVRRAFINELFGNRIEFLKWGKCGDE